PEMAERLKARVPWGARRHWRALRRGFRLRADADALRERCAALIRLAVRQRVFQPALVATTLPSVMQSCPLSVVVPVLDLAVRLSLRHRSETARRLAREVFRTARPRDVPGRARVRDSPRRLEARSDGPPWARSRGEPFDLPIARIPDDARDDRASRRRAEPEG